MRLFEFASADSPTNSPEDLIVAIDRIKTDVDNKKIPTKISTDAFLKHLREKYNVILDKSDLMNMYNQEPLKSVVKNINDKFIMFSDTENEIDAKDDNREIVKQMAKNASKS